MLVLGKKVDFEESVPIRKKGAELIELKLGDDFAGVVPAKTAQWLSQALGITIDELMLRLSQYASCFARPPISKFRVGAVARGGTGDLYFGANIEFLEEALSFSVHGEQAATANAILHGETELVALAVNAAPCGYCRQFLYEISSANTLVIVVQDGPALLTTLLPAPFGPKDLGIDSALMDPQHHKLELLEPNSDLVVSAALEQADKSYAPYTACYSGVALGTADGTIYRGSYAENAAYNPSMSPMEAALVNFIFSGRPYSDICSAVLVEAESSPASQVEATRNVLASISDVTLAIHFAEVV